MPLSLNGRRSDTRLDAAEALLALVIGHQTRIAAGRAATAREPRRAEAARRALDAVTRALVELERLVLPDRATRAGERSSAGPLPVAGTITPAERAWVLGWHLLAATARIHGRASDAGRPKFGERETAQALALVREALRQLEPLLTRGRRAELRATFASATFSLHEQQRLFGPLLLAPHGRPARDVTVPHR